MMINSKTQIKCTYLVFCFVMQDRVYLDYTPWGQTQYHFLWRMPQMSV